MHRFDLAIVGAGPAGMAAAREAAEAGLKVALVDEQPRAGGQAPGRLRFGVAEDPEEAEAAEEDAQIPEVTESARACSYYPS